MIVFLIWLIGVVISLIAYSIIMTDKRKRTKADLGRLVHTSTESPIGDLALMAVLKGYRPLVVDVLTVIAVSVAWPVNLLVMLSQHEYYRPWEWAFR